MSGDHKLVESYSILRKKFNKSYVKKGRETNIGNLIDDYYSKVLYGRKKVDEGTFRMFGKEVDTAKTLDNFKKYTGALGMGLNVFAGINNILMGKMQIAIEALGGEYFSIKNSSIGKKNYWTLLPEYMSELSSTSKRSKLKLLTEMFDS